MDDIHRSLRTALAACVISAVWATVSQAADESPWSEDVRSASRIVAGSGKSGDAQLRAGIEIKMQPGWKTYWRYPGDSGVPPHFDFSGSENLKTATVLYPAPHVVHRRDRANARLQRTRHFSGGRFAATGRQAGSVAPENRLRGLREIVRAGGRTRRTRPRVRATAPTTQI